MSEDSFLTHWVSVAPFKEEAMLLFQIGVNGLPLKTLSKPFSLMVLVHLRWHNRKETPRLLLPSDAFHNVFWLLKSENILLAFFLTFSAWQRQEKKHVQYLSVELPLETIYMTNYKTLIKHQSCTVQILRHQIWFYEKPAFPLLNKNIGDTTVLQPTNQSHDVCDEPSHTCRVQYCVWSKAIKK